MSVLNITAKAAPPLSQMKTQALVVLMPERKSLGAAMKALDKFLGGTVSRNATHGDFSPTIGATCWLPGAGAVHRVLLVGCGDVNQRTVASDKKLAETLSRALLSCAAKDAII